MMLDSGCAQSLMIMGIYKRIRSAFCLGVRPVKSNEILADGSKITFEGVADVTFKIEECEFQHKFVLADISYHVLLRLDFFKQRACSIDFCMASAFGSNYRLLRRVRRESES